MCKRFFYLRLPKPKKKVAKPLLNPTFGSILRFKMNSSFLLNLILILIPLGLSFDKRGRVFKDWRAIIPTVLFTGILAVVIKLTFTNYRMVSYDPELFGGIYFYEIPLESVLFCFSVPFAGLIGYNYLNSHFPNNDLEIYSLAFSHVLMGLSVAVLFFAYTKIYAVVSFSAFLLLLLYIEYVNKYRFMYRFYRLYVVFFFLYGLAALLFTGIKAPKYNEPQGLEFKLVAIPFENYFLLGALLLCAVYLFELFKRRNHGIA